MFDDDDDVVVVDDDVVDNVVDIRRPRAISIARRKRAPSTPGNGEYGNSSVKSSIAVLAKFNVVRFVCQVAIEPKSAK